MTNTKILIVEDEWIIADDLQDRLTDLGFSILDMVSSGEEAIEKVEKNKPNLVLMDIQLDGDMGGIEAGNHIQSLFNIPVIYISAHMDNHRNKKESGIIHYVNKPFDEEELIRVIGNALRNKNVL